MTIQSNIFVWIYRKSVVMKSKSSKSIEAILFFNEIWSNIVDSDLDNYNDYFPYPLTFYHRMEETRLVPYWSAVREQFLSILCASLVYEQSGIIYDYKLLGNLIEHSTVNSDIDLTGIHALSSTIEELMEKLLPVTFLSLENMCYMDSKEDSLDYFIKNNFGYKVLAEKNTCDYDDIRYQYINNNIVIPVLIKCDINIDTVKDIIDINTPDFAEYDISGIPVKYNDGIGSLMLLFPRASYFEETNEVLKQAIDYTAFAQIIYQCKGDYNE